MTAEGSLREVLDVLGDPPSRHVRSNDAWRNLENDLGFALPDDYKTIIDTYAPVHLYGHLYLHHPATERWNLRHWINETVTAWSEVEWEDELDGDPLAILGTDGMRFGTADGLAPSSDRTAEKPSFSRGTAWASHSYSRRVGMKSSSARPSPSPNGCANTSAERTSSAPAAAFSIRARSSSGASP